MGAQYDALLRTVASKSEMEPPAGRSAPETASR
jgi:hypothetical protein